MTTPRMITAAWLKSNKACPDAIDLFCAEWPEGCEATHDNLVHADAIGLDMEWFAKRVLPPQVFAAYEDSRSALLADYRAKRDPLHADFLNKCAALIISTLLNHYDALPAINAAGGN